MFMQEEFDKLLKMLSNSKEGKVKLEDVLHSSMALFDQLRELLKDSTPEQKAELAKAMKEMHTKLSTEAKSLMEKTGLNEDELMAFNENSNNFTKEQWAVMQEAKKKMLDATAVMGRFNRTPKEGSEEPKGPRAKKESWVRS